MKTYLITVSVRLSSKSYFTDHEHRIKASSAATAVARAMRETKKFVGRKVISEWRMKALAV